MQGTFADSFPELQEFAKERESASFDFLRRSLRLEAGRGDESFEAFGLKVPTPTTAIWGAFILLGVQLYFLAHLKEFSSRLSHSDIGQSDVAWIGVYQENFSRLLFVGSAFILPMATEGILVWKATSLLDSSTAKFGITIMFFGSIVIGCLTMSAFMETQRIGFPMEKIGNQNTRTQLPFAGKKGV